MRRREFITLLGGTAAAWPLAARAEQPATPVIGFLGGADPVGYAPQIQALRLGLRDYGYIDGLNIAVEYRWAEGKYDRLPVLAADLVRRKVAVIITQGTPAAFAAKQATTTIPIVMAIVGNPVETGIVTSLARPGGNITGSSFFYAELSAKRTRDHEGVDAAPYPRWRSSQSRQSGHAFDRARDDADGEDDRCHASIHRGAGSRSA